MAKPNVRRFRGPWPQVYPRMQLYLLEMLAARPDPGAIHLRLAKALATPEEMRRDVPALRDALVRRLGSGRVHCEAVDGAESHEIRVECARASTVKAETPGLSSRT
jgi:hypothetical protein